MRFSERELRDLAVAWVALGVAFTVLINLGTVRASLADPAVLLDSELASAFLVSMLTVGVGFLLHELAHKVVAVRFGQVAEFRADYTMLFVALAGAFMGFLFAAPGAVHHRGRISARENGLIAVAGPVTNLALAAGFFALAIPFSTGFLGRIAGLGLFINLLLAGFNMIPFGPLDGKTVLDWNKLVYAVVAVPSIGLAALAFFVGF